MVETKITRLSRQRTRSVRMTRETPLGRARVTPSHPDLEGPGARRETRSSLGALAQGANKLGS